MRGSSRSEMINESSTAPARIFTITCIEGRRKFPSGRRAGKEKERERESRCFLSSVSKRICTLVHRKHTLGMCRNTKPSCRASGSKHCPSRASGTAKYSAVIYVATNKNHIRMRKLSGLQLLETAELKF